MGFTISSVISTPCNVVQRLSVKKQNATTKRSVVTMSATAPQEMGKRVAGSFALSSMVNVLPALAIVDVRLNGDGTGLPLGINDGALGIILATVPLAIFGLYFVAGKQDASIVAGGKDDDSGLSL